jgi:hypothetical protein
LAQVNHDDVTQSNARREGAYSKPKQTLIRRKPMFLFSFRFRDV